MAARLRSAPRVVQRASALLPSLWSQQAALPAPTGDMIVAGALSN